MSRYIFFSGRCLSLSCLSAGKVEEESERTIANILVRVKSPKDEALEVQSANVSLPDTVVCGCLICGKRLLGKYAFSKHLRQKHSRGSYTCKSCAQVFSSGYKLHEHARLKKHDSSGAQKYKKTTYNCDVGGCGKTFATFNAFRDHCVTTHSMFPLECKLCKKRYKEQATFKNHMETHAGVLKYECDVCSKKFVTRERLFAHRRLHLGKRFVCSQCDFKGRSGTALRNHILMKHAERRFQCFLCSKKFGSKQNLEQHEVVHTGMASWHCSACDMSFKRHHHYKTHLSSQSHRNKSRSTVPKPIAAKEPAMLDIDDPGLKTQNNDFSLVIPLNLEHSLASGEQHSIVDDDLMNLADTNSELFLDDTNVQLIIVNEANEDVMLMTSNEVKLSDAATDDTNII